MKNLRLDSKLITKKSLTADVLEIKIVKPANFTFTPGQFIQFYIPHADGEQLRAYSIANLPDAPELTFIIKILPNGLASTYFTDLAIGSSLHITESQGFFHIKTDNKPLIYLAGGTGLAPVYSHLLFLTANHDQRPIILFFGVKHEENIFYLEELQKISDTLPNFKYQIVLSEPSESWTGPSGYVNEHLPSDLPNYDYYLAGAPEMVRTITMKLVTAKVPVPQIHFEAY
ncbi:MAG TPA: FAD-binding oxidoreductase [Candidatus Magasanikbacteria bacterium]|nr:FAD-binding oxidoreductase [Candidatus Magasanikbacteria bacterium]